MLTYQLQNRILKVIDGPSTLAFPNKLIIDIEYGPPEMFGISNKPSRLMLAGSKSLLLYNANSGRMQVQSEPPLKPLNVRVQEDNVIFELKMNKLHLVASCHDGTEFENILRTFYHGFPALLNIEFPDPPVPVLLEGSLGETKFRWEHKQATFFCTSKTKDALEQHIVDSLNNIQFLGGRLLAAVQYLHTASRLIVSGQSSWEFMAESILNMCKVLQVMFGESMDSVRKHLNELGYSLDEVEGDFIPIMVLRSHFDIGHAQVVIPQSEQLQILYNYLSISENKMRQLIKRVLNRVAEDSYRFPKQQYLGFEREKQTKFNKLIDMIKTRTIITNKNTS